MRDATTTLAIATCITTVILYSVSVYFFSLKPSTLQILSSEPLFPQPSAHQSASPKDSPKMAVDLNWYQPNATWITNLTDIINGTGTHGFSFFADGPGKGTYGEYNWCDMPHVRAKEYVKAREEFELIYVEVVCNFLLIFFLIFFFSNFLPSRITLCLYCLLSIFMPLLRI
jgi:hypothetical protein